MKELALHIMDIVQNSIRAKATEILICIKESKKDNNLIIEIEDNGTGISKEMLPTITDPYTTSRTTRKVGMGLPLLRQHAELAGGNLSIASQQGKGTKITAVFVKDHLDLQPMGDLPGVIKLLLAANPAIEFKYRHTTDKGEFVFSAAEAREMLEVDNFNDYYLLEQLKSLISENLKELDAGL